MHILLKNILFKHLSNYSTYISNELVKLKEKWKKNIEIIMR